MTSYKKLLLATAACLSMCFSVHAQTLLPINYISADAQSNGVFVTANYYGQCPTRPVSAQIYLVNNGVATYQSACLINPAWNSFDNQTLKDPNIGFCSFREPRTQNPANSILLRLWKSTSDCNSYAYEVGQVGVTAYQDVFVNGYTPSKYFYGLTANSLITIDKPNYKIRLDRNGGATYEFYNKRATLNGAPFTSNSVLADVGAALQIAIQHPPSQGPTLTTASCDPAQGYWNPTQTGNFCTIGTNVGAAPPAQSTKCDGVANNNCTAATSTVEIGEHNMRNWDYGTGYTGPLNAGDTARMSQKISAFENYVEYDIALKHTGTSIKNQAFIEIPTFYFQSGFRRWSVKHQGQSQVTTTTIPDRLGNLPLTPSQLGMVYPDANPNDGFINEDVSWVSLENTKGTVNDAYTIAWFYKPTFRSDISWPNYGYTVSEQDIYRVIKFANLPTFNMQPGKQYNFKYVVFPYKYNEVINSPYGTMTVESVISNMKLAYEQ